MNFKASIIIPVYNEVDSLEIFCFKLKEAFQNINVKYIFIDDGSTDGSCDWLTKNLNNYFNTKELNLISLKKNYGKGYAIKEGIKKLEGSLTSSEAIDIWEKNTNLSSKNYKFYRIFSLLKFTIIMIRVAKKLMINNIIELEKDFYKNNYISNFLEKEFKQI